MARPEKRRPNARVALIGARGYVGAELIRLLAHHPSFDHVCASSRTHAGKPVRKIVSNADSCSLVFEDLSPADVCNRDDLDVLILALPNGLAAEYVSAVKAGPRPGVIIIDMSADYRFDDGWVYGQTEAYRQQLRNAKRISNPGCYATIMQLIIRPLVSLLAEPPFCFGVSGYSGAGTTPSPKNDPEQLRDNLMPYALTDHIHEREVSRHLGVPVRFMPHVAPFFRGISMTVGISLHEPTDVATIAALYAHAYANEPLIRLTAGEHPPLVRDNAMKHHAAIGGWSVSAADPQQLTVVGTLDNLLKGAATQAIQNINIACGFDELEGIEPWLTTDT
ncbi:MAG: N-acetyl-gamma-glutamyl-phosphate reductase [Planctomycetes bacterium]|nr:N-acetyl-gamma-glutamyl-phosphate reductase [Planctomycetota bacterium]NOG56058.1 N-acetyl-gamma-glutamyl-phosphate reductase [Planctomycetota bacterium]